MKKIVSILLVFVLFIGILSGCTSKRDYSDNEIIIDEPLPGPPPISDEVRLSNDEENGTEEKGDKQPIMTNIFHFGEKRNESKKENPKRPNDLRRFPVEKIESEDFESSLIDYTLLNGYNKQNFMISPLSLKLTLILAIEGANGDTKDELLKSLGFESYEDMQGWYTCVLESMTAFENNPTKKSDWAYKIANAVWANTNYIPEFNPEYIQNIAEKYNAEAKKESSSHINDAVSEWVKDATNGFIENLEVDLSGVPASLINALYLKSGWVNPFKASNTEEGKFLTVNGNIVTKDFMSQTNHFLYYEDDFTQLVVLPLGGGINAVFVLGSTFEINKKLDQATMQNVYVKLPKFEINSRFENQFFIDYFNTMGYKTPFNDESDFSKMIDTENGKFSIDDIIQVTRIDTDEDGIEAAAVTVVALRNASFITEQEKIEFIADNPFTFYIMDANNSNELLFYGQVVE